MELSAQQQVDLGSKQAFFQLVGGRAFLSEIDISIYLEKGKRRKRKSKTKKRWTGAGGTGGVGVHVCN